MIVTYECTENVNDPDWDDEEGGSLCPVCGAEGRIKPPAPPGGTKVKP